MARFTIAKKKPSENGWSQSRLAAAKQLSDDFDPLTVTHHEFVEQLVEHHLSQIHSHYQ